VDTCVHFSFYTSILNETNVSKWLSSEHAIERYCILSPPLLCIESASYRVKRQRFSEDPSSRMAYGT